MLGVQQCSEWEGGQAIVRKFFQVSIYDNLPKEERDQGL